MSGGGERASIDDLFSGDPDGVGGADPAGPRLVRVVSLLASAAVLTALAFVALRMVELTAPILVLFAASVTFVLMWRSSRGLHPPLASRHAGRHHEERVVIPDGVRLAIARWDTMLDWSHTDAGRFNRKVVPRLAEVVDERLRQRHGITRAGDPRRAREILGDSLWSFLTMPSRRPPQPRELDQIVTALEKL